MNAIEAAAARAVPDPGTVRRRWLALAVIGIAQLMVMLDLTVMNVELPSAQRALHVTNADRQWVVTAYSLATVIKLIVIAHRARGAVSNNRHASIRGICLHLQTSRPCGPRLSPARKSPDSGNSRSQ